MAAFAFVGVPKYRDVPGVGKVYSGVATMGSTDLTGSSGSLIVPKGAITLVQLTEIDTDEGWYCDSVPTAAVGTQTPTITPTAGATLGADYITIARTGSTSASKFFFRVEYGT